MLSSFIKIPRFSVALHYALNDSGRMRNMVVHHGLNGSFKNFKNITKDQQISDYVNSYLIDCRNHGQSPHTTSNKISDLADDLHEFVLHHKLHKNKKLTLMGHSMGAMALMAFTEKYPQMQEFVDRVILIDINCAPRKEDKGVANTGAMLRSMLEIDLSQDTKTVFRAIEERAINKDTAGLIKTNIEVLGEKQHRWIPNLEVILKDFDELINFELHKNDWRKPVEVIYGAQSVFVSKYQLQKYLELYPQMKKQENLYRIENAEHVLHQQNPTQFLKAFEHILKKDQLTVQNFSQAANDF